MKWPTIKSVGRKFSGGEGATEKRSKISKKYRKIALLASSRKGRGEQLKKDRKIALLSLYLLYLYHV